VAGTKSYDVVLEALNSFSTPPFLPYTISRLPNSLYLSIRTMVFVRRSVLRAANAAQAFRAAPFVRRSGQVLGRRFYSSGKGHEEHKTSDLPWYVLVLLFMLRSMGYSY